MSAENSPFQVKATPMRCIAERGVRIRCIVLAALASAALCACPALAVIYDPSTAPRSVPSKPDEATLDKQQAEAPFIPLKQWPKEWKKVEKPNVKLPSDSPAAILAHHAQRRLSNDKARSGSGSGNSVPGSAISIAAKRRRVVVNIALFGGVILATGLAALGLGAFSSRKIVLPERVETEPEEIPEEWGDWENWPDEEPQKG